MRISSILGAVALLSAVAAQAAPVEYKIATDHSFPAFEINHMGFSTFRGRFDRISGTVTLDSQAKKVSADVTIDATSISTGVAKLDDHLKTADFLDVATYPTITFKSTGSKFKGDKLVSLTGDLTMHGVTRPLTLVVDSFACHEHPLYKVPACGADAHAVIKRLDWGGIGKKLPATIIGEVVTLRIQIEARVNP